MKTKATTIYFPHNLHHEIKKISQVENRSFNQQVIALLKKAIGDQITRAGKGGEK